MDGFNNNHLFLYSASTTPFFFFFFFFTVPLRRLFFSSPTFVFWCGRFSVFLVHNAESLCFFQLNAELLVHREAS